MRDPYSRDFEDWIMDEVYPDDIYPISPTPRPMITYNFRNPFTILHNGPDGKFKGARTITFTCSRSNTRLTVVESNGWEDHVVDPERTLRRVAASGFYEVLGKSGHVFLDESRCSDAEEQETNFDSQQVEYQSQPLDFDNEMETSAGKRGVRFYG
ncbi:uncharacterized protein EI90DRAFT_3152097 [Cantharellus anzutake]|uniref:uncharacterized protein n=1 Tax=Cantharellus anzutake TaxID=1750568 RepID=UPI0019052CFF|nr:uncharacterized protein EI90DRAFT_3152097 [Cantharellus anzutake]KAF8337395.1 hypothetical protein EI90DRAFT_3152097 [Cantharellus anzutake]